jgi:hypothetical protein
MEDIKKIQEFFSKSLEENIVVRMYNTTDKTADLYKEDNPGLEFYLTGKEGQDYVRKYKDHISFPFSSHMNDGTPIPNYEENKEKLTAYLKQKGIPFKTTSAKPYRGVSRTTGEDFMYTTDTFKVPLSHVDIKDISLNENKVTKEDFNKVVQILGKSKYPFTIMLVPKWDEIDIITGQDSPDEIVDDIGQRLDSAGLNWGGNSGITISGDSSNYSRKEYSDIFRVNGGHQDYFEESVNENTFKKGDKVTYLGHPAVVTATKEYNGRDFVSVSYDKGTGKTSASMILATSGDVKAVNEMDINDPILMKMRASKMKADKFAGSDPKAGSTIKGRGFDWDKNTIKIDKLKKKRAQIMSDMEQEAEPEGGPIADEYGSKLNRIDAAIAKLSGRKEMDYDTAVGKVNEYDVYMPSQEEVDRFFALTNNETHYLNSKPVMGQEGTFNLMPIEPWDEYDYSNWKALVRKAKAKGKSLDEVKVDYDFSERELIRVLRQLKRGASTEIDMIKAFTKALGRDITKDELFSESIDEASRARVSMPRFVKDKNNPNFLNVYIDYDLGPGGALIALGKETMTGQIRRESAAEAMRLAGDVARDLEAEYDLEDIDIQDLENGKVRIFAVSDDFINMNPNMLSEASKGAMNYFSDLKYNYQKAFRYLDVEEREEYKRLVKDFFSKLQVDDKVRAVGLEEAKVELDDTTQFKLDLKHLLDKHIVKEASKEEENEFHKELDKLVHKTFGHSSDEKKKSIAQTLAETIKLGEGVIEEELCPKGKAYIKRRKAAGEKSSAYLSGRAVKVCKGQMSGRKKKK